MIDEIGYLTFGQEATSVLFHVNNDRQFRKRPMIFTANKLLSEWGKFYTMRIGGAILDRILERVLLFDLMGPRST